MRPRILALSRDRGSMQAIAPAVVALRASLALEVITYATRESSHITSGLGLRAARLDDSAFASDPEACLRRLFDVHDPDLVLSGLSPVRGTAPETPEQYAVLEARRRCIPSLAVQDYWGMYAERFSRDGNTLDQDLLPDRLCILDRRARSDLEAFGVPEQRMAITHNPWLDRLVAEAALFDRCVSGAYTVLLASQPLAEMQHVRYRPYDQYTLFECLLAAIPYRAANRSAATIQVLPHPSEDRARWQALLVRTGRADIQVVLCHEGVPSLLRDADYVVTSHSTLAYEALYFGTPCIALRPGAESLPRTWIEEVGLSQVFHDVESLSRYLRESDPAAERQRVLQLKRELGAAGLFFSDGNATGRVVNEIMALLKPIAAAS